MQGFKKHLKAMHDSGDYQEIMGYIIGVQEVFHGTKCLRSKQLLIPAEQGSDDTSWNNASARELLATTCAKYEETLIGNVIRRNSLTPLLSALI